MFVRDATNLVVAIFSLVLLSVSAFSASAQNLLAPGDRVSLMVIGARDLDTVAMVDPDGFATFPVAGRLPARGLTVEQLQADVAKALSLEPLQLETTAAETVWVKIGPSNVFLTLFEYRPIYVSGQVRTVGEQPYRPGMTARQALALAGGPGRAAEVLDEAELANILAEKAILNERLAIATADVMRLQTEMASIDANETGEMPDLGKTGQHMTQAADAWLKARGQLRDLNKSAATLTLSQMEDRLDVLSQLEQVNVETLKTYEDEYKRATDLAARGVVTANSVTDAQRGLLSFSTRALETTSEAYKVRTDIARTKERTEAKRTEDRVETLAELIRSTKDVQDIRGRLKALDMELSFWGESSTDLSQAPPTVVIFRNTEGTETRIDASLETLVAPGDVVEFLASDVKTD